MKNKFKIKETNGNIFRSFFRGIKLGINNFWRNKYLSIATIIVMAVIIFIFNVIMAIQFIGNQALQSLSERVDIVIYLNNDIDFYSAKKLTMDIEKISGVDKVKYTSKQEALDIVAKTHPKTEEFLTKFNLENPLPPSISITTKSAEDHMKVKQFLEQDKYSSLMKNYLAEGSTGESKILSTVAQNLEKISTFIRQVIFWMILVFILGGTLIIVNAIQITIFNRRQEIHIMRLVGATTSYIRLPFVFESILYAVFAVCISFLMLGIISQTIEFDESNIWTYYSNINMYNIFIIELAITTLLAIVSSFSSAEQHIKGNLNLN